MRITGHRWAMAGVTALALALAGSNVAHATPTGSIGFSALGGATADTTDLTTATSLTIASPFVTAGTGQGDFSGIPAATAIALSTTSYSVTTLGDLVSITPFTLTVDGDTFTFDQQEVTVNNHTGSGPGEHAELAIDFVGSVTGPDVTGGTDTASATYTFDQTGGAGAAISFAGTAAHPAQAIGVGVGVGVPEPIGMASLGIGLLGLGLVRRRSA